MLGDETGLHDVADVLHDATPEKRGRGRPPGSLNRPKPPKLTPQEAEALKQELAPKYVAAVVTRAKVELHVRGLKSLIATRLGRQTLAEVEAAVVATVENEGLADSQREEQRGATAA